MLWVLLVSAGLAGADVAPAHLTISPTEVVLRGQGVRQRVIVTLMSAGGSKDRTREATYRSEAPGIARVDEGGLVVPVSDGDGFIVAAADGLEARVPIRVSGSSAPSSVTFETDVVPVLTRAGCNSGPCHGKQRGQNGFQLSLLGFDAGFDWSAIARGVGGRRVCLAAPGESLLILKPTAALPHGGGRRLERGSASLATLLRWIELGLPRDPPGAPALEKVTIDPGERVLSPGETQQLIVAAVYSDGSRRDVTALAAFQSSESAVVSVDEQGLAKAGPVAGDAAVMARYLGKIATSSISIPVAGSVAHDLYARLPRPSFIDDLVWRKLERLGITPSERADDAKLLRRAFIDVIGRLPSPGEVRAFLNDASPEKRARLVDGLLERPEYADHWASKWQDLLRPNPYRVGIKAVLNLDAWIRDAFRKNLPYDRFVRDVVTAQGSTFQPGAATVFRDRRSPDEIAPMVSQLFLGVRLECAKCHHHPFEAFGQEDFYGFAAYFARVGYKGTGLSPPISGSEEVIFTAASGTATHPRTGAVLEPKPLFGDSPRLDAGRDPREALADWMVAPENPYFARAIVNRVWADLMGVGLVEPVDDLRATNPPSNPELLGALAERFRADKFDLKKLIRAILASHVYALESRPTGRNVADTRNYSRHYRQRLRAEVIVDAVSDVTGVPESFSAMPPGSRAAEVWTHRVESTSLDSFGRPDPNQDPPCTRTSDTTLVQALHLMNSPRFHEKVTAESGRAARLAASALAPREIVEEIYLACYSRFPAEKELAAALRLLGGGPASRRSACEDLMWALINTPEFVFKD